jgi:hypothetical protein
MPFKSDRQRKFMEAITHNADFARQAHVSPEAIKPFVADAEKAPQPKIEKVKVPKFGKLLAKMQGH